MQTLTWYRGSKLAKHKQFALVPVGNLIWLASEAYSRIASVL
jgi:hypothetical protein